MQIFIFNSFALLLSEGWSALHPLLRSSDQVTDLRASINSTNGHFETLSCAKAHKHAGEKVSQCCHFTATYNTPRVRKTISQIHSPLRAAFVMNSKITANCPSMGDLCPREDVPSSSEPEVNPAEVHRLQDLPLRWDGSSALAKANPMFFSEPKEHE